MTGAQVHLVLIYLEQVKDFEQQLPADTQQELAKGGEGGLKNYPIYETGGGSLSSILPKSFEMF